jgi:hypothetical protein
MKGGAENRENRREESETQELRKAGAGAIPYSVVEK